MQYAFLLIKSLLDMHYTLLWYAIHILQDNSIWRMEQLCITHLYFLALSFAQTLHTFLLWLGGVRWFHPLWCRSLKQVTTASAIDTLFLSLRWTFLLLTYSLQSGYLWLAGRPTCPSPMVFLNTLPCAQLWSPIVPPVVLPLHCCLSPHLHEQIV